MARKMGILAVCMLLLQLSVNLPKTEAAVFDNKVQEQKKLLAPDVTHIKENYQSGNIKEAVNILDVNLNNTYTKLELGLPNPINALRTTTSTARENSYEGHRVVGAVNASFFLGSGPANLLAKNNQIINYGILGDKYDSPTQQPVAFGISQSGKAIADYYKTDLSFTVNGETFPINLINTERTENKNVLYSSAKKTTGTNEWGMEIVVKAASKSTKELYFGDSFTGTISSVTQYGQPGNSTIPEDGFVISVQNKELATKLSSLPIDSPIEVQLSIDDKWKDAQFILAAGPLLVKDGQVNISMPNNSSFVTARSDRTAVAVDATGTRVFLVTVDGRQSGYSNGTNLKDLASYLISKGAYAAINLDGGGSTTMAIRQPFTLSPVLANRPSGGSERRVSSILQIVNTAPTGSAKIIVLNKVENSVLLGNSINLAVSQIFDEYMNPFSFDPTKVKWTVEGNIGMLEGAKFTATAVGNGKIIAEYEGAKTEVNIEVVDTLYKDVKSSYWAYPAIKNLNTRGLIKGYPDGTFKPQNTITRAEAATIVARALDLKKTMNPSFSDVKSTHYAYNEIAAVAEKGILMGRDPGKFAPEGQLTRAEMATILKRAYQLSGVGTAQFKDLSSKHWAYKDINILVANNLITGYEDGTYRPENKITRAEFATMLDRVSK